MRPTNELFPRTRAQLNERVLAVVELQTVGYRRLLPAAWQAELLSDRLRRPSRHGLARRCRLCPRQTRRSHGSARRCGSRPTMSRSNAAGRCPYDRDVAMVARRPQQGYGSDADVLFFHEPARGWPYDVAAAAAHSVAERVCGRLLQPAGAGTPAAGHADLRPEEVRVRVTRSLAALSGYYGAFGPMSGAQALLRAAHLAGDGGAHRRVPRPHRSGALARGWPRRGLPVWRSSGSSPWWRPSGAPGTDPRSPLSWAGRVVRRRVDRPDAPASASPTAVPRCATPSNLGALAAAEQAELTRTADAGVLRDAWHLATRAATR